MEITLKNLNKYYMRTLLCILIPMLSFAQQTIILDLNFEQALIDLGYDNVLDNSITTNSIDTVTTLELAGKNISDLTGLEDFTALKYLYCYSNNLSELDVSNNFFLEHLYCGNNNLTELNLSNNNLLKFLSCDNNNFVELDLSSNVLLSSVICFDSNLSELNVTNNTELLFLNCGNNNLSDLNIINNTELELLNCSNNNLSELNISNNTNLNNLYCSDNNLSELNISNNTMLSQINCAANNITTLNTSFNTELISLNCSWNSLSNLFLENNINLEQLSCYGNNLSDLNVSNNTILSSLYCYLNNLSELNLSSNVALEALSCYDNNIDCIQVADVEYADNTFIKDDSAIWSFDCEYPLICQDGEYPIAIESSTGDWAYEMAWGLWDYDTWMGEDGPTEENSIAFFQGQNNYETSDVEMCLPSSGCYMFAAYDSYGDGWNEGFIVVNINNSKMPETYLLEDGTWGYWSFEVDSEPCNWEIPGCTNPDATNYNDLATTDDGSCIVPFFFDWDNEQREYFLYIPENLQPNAPLVFALHGYWGEGADMIGLFTDLADDYGFAVCYPNGLIDNFGASHWNANFDESMTAVDDVGFLSNLAIHLQEAYNLSPEKTFSCGMSNGGYMSWSLACRAPDVFKAIASVTGTMSGPDWVDCNPSELVPVMQISGTADNVVPMDGSMGYVSEGWGGAPDIYTIMDYWSELHGCTNTETINWQWDYSTDVTQYFSCTYNTSFDLRLYVANGMGHTWPNFAEEQIWDFFMQIAANPINILEKESADKVLLKTVDILGRNSSEKTFSINIYDDGSISKNYMLD